MNRTDTYNNIVRISIKRTELAMLQPSGWQDEYAKLGKQLDELTGQWMEASKQESHEDS